MQVGTRQSYQVQTQRMASIQSLIERLQMQVSTGKRLADASDDPVGSARVAQIQRALDDNTQYVRNIDTAVTKLTTTDNAVETLANTVTRIQELALLASNGTFNQSDRKTVAAELDQLRATLLATANTRDINGDYVFAGARVGHPAFAEDADGVVQFQGAGRVAEIPVTPTATVRTVERGDELMNIDTTEGRVSVFQMVDDLRALLDRPDPISAEEEASRVADYATAIGGIELAVSKFNDTRAVLGGRINRVEAEAERLRTLNVALEEGKSNIESADLTAAITDLQGAMLILKASQQSFAQIKSMSLFDQIR